MELMILIITLCCLITQVCTKRVVAENQRNAVKRTLTTGKRLKFEICSVWDFTWCSGDGICCPDMVHCCPVYKPVCFVAAGKCCSRDHPDLCGTTDCCTEEEFCCGDKVCCIEADACCSSSEGSECCDLETNFCAGIHGCVAPCPSPFEAVGCLLTRRDSKLRTSKKVGVPDFLYRVIRPDENPSAIVARNPEGNLLLKQHIAFGSRPWFPTWKGGSQFISTTRNYDVAKKWYDRGIAAGKTGLRIVKIDTDDLSVLTKILDLTDRDTRLLYGITANMVVNFVTASQEVILKSPLPIKSTVMKLRRWYWSMRG